MARKPGLEYLDNEGQETEGLDVDSLRGSEHFIPGFGLQNRGALPVPPNYSAADLARSATVDPALKDEARARGGNIEAADAQKILEENQDLRERLEALESQDREFMLRHSTPEVDTYDARREHEARLANEQRASENAVLVDANPEATSPPAQPTNAPVIDPGKNP